MLNLITLSLKLQISQKGKQLMHRRAIQRFNFSMYQHSKHQVSKMKSDMTRLFQCKKSKKQLFKHLKIMPHYFSLDLLNQFFKSRIHEEFWANNIEFEKEEGDTDFLLKHFTSTRLQRAISSPTLLQGLEAYIHWLMNYYQGFDLHQNNYIQEVLNQEKPEMQFQIKEYCSSRTFIYHHGPTNSGKSTSAIEDLRNLKGNQKGIYMAPLRLLAWEYQQKLENCSLLTGQEKQFKNSNLISCTIQAAPLYEKYEVAVIDEIQMLGDADRGWAWTKAVLGVKAKRVHLCGDERALGIISKLLQLTGDTLEERRYSRLSKLTLIHKQFKLEDISPGDCVINFSMNSLIEHRNDINNFTNSRNKAINPPEQKDISNSLQQNEAPKIIQQTDIDKTNHTAIVYGRLPPECRKSQALKFNTRQLPYLVATNAIGMGLNLNIRKVVFLSIERTNGKCTELLQEHEIQQIAGRAGRGKETGYVQCANLFILKKVQKALSRVNEIYGIQLQNIKDESNEIVQAVDEDQQEETKSNQQYSTLLKRYLKEKESNIKAAYFYFQNEYIVYFKGHLEKNLKKQISNVEVLAYLQDYCKLGELYFMQEGKSLNYVLSLLENSNMDQDQLFIFLNGLVLSAPGNFTHKFLRSRMENSHRQYIQNFVKYRKVDLPQFLVNQYEQKFSQFCYMDQVADYQYYYNLLETYVWLWGKFQFAFHQIQLAKEIKLALSKKINQVLLRNQFISQNIGLNSFQVAQKKYGRKSKDKTKQLSRIDSLIPLYHKNIPVEIDPKKLQNQNGKQFFQEPIQESNTTLSQSQQVKNLILQQIFEFKKKQQCNIKSPQQIKESSNHSKTQEQNRLSTKVHEELELKNQQTLENNQQNQASENNQKRGFFSEKASKNKPKDKNGIDTETSESESKFHNDKSSRETSQKQLAREFFRSIHQKKALAKIQHID